MRDTIHGVKVDFLLTGDYPGDGLPKPVAFPDPAQASIQGEQFRVLGLAALVELKLASAMSAPHRGGDFFDVVNLVRRGGAQADLREQLNPYVRAKFDEAVALAAAAEADDY